MTIKKKKEALWASYHVLCSSLKFRTTWEEFVFTAVGKKPSPIFFQHIMHNVFKELIKAEFLVSGENDGTSDIC